MSKNLLVIVCLFLISNTYSQDKTRDEVLQLMAYDTCECIKSDKESFAIGKTMNQKQVALGLCLLKSFNKRKAESKEMQDAGIDNFDVIGEEVGLKMVSACGTDFMAIFTDDQLGEIIDEALEDDVPPPPSAKNNEDFQLDAELMSLNNDAISYFKLKDAFNKTHVFIIREQFEGFKLLKKSNYKKDFKVYYKEVDFFDLSERKYIKKKVVKYLELIN